MPQTTAKLYEIKPGARRRPIERRGVANMINGVSYSVGPGGIPIMDERAARDEERQLEAEAELRDLEWERSGFGGPMESEETQFAYSVKEGQELVEEEPASQSASGFHQGEFVKRGANYVPLDRAQLRVGERLYESQVDGAYLVIGKIKRQEAENE